MKLTNIFFTIFSVLFLICVYFTTVGYISHREYLIFENMYKSGQYEEILDIYSENNTNLWLHNKGNASFRVYSESGNPDFLEQSLRYFSGSLDLQEHPDTRYNYEYIVSLLERQEDSRESQSSLEEDDSFQEENNDQNTQEEISSSGDEENTKEAGDSASSNIQDIPSGEDELSQQGQQEIDEQIEALKRDQIYNQQYFGGASGNTDGFSDVFESFFEQIDRGGEKDW